MNYLHELEPEEYTIDGDFTNLGEHEPAIFGHRFIDAVAGCADQLGFVVVQNSFSLPVFEALEEDCREVLAEHDTRRWTQKIDTTEAIRIDKTPEARTVLPQRSQNMLGDVALRLQQASADKKRMSTDNAEIATSYILRMLYKAKVGPHRDPVTGVMCETALTGAETVALQSEDGWKARVRLRPNDTLIMPAYTFGTFTSQRKPLKHSVANTTRLREGRGRRLSVFYNYGRQSSD
jgi:hypothetical protein